MQLHLTLKDINSLRLYNI